MEKKTYHFRYSYHSDFSPAIKHHFLKLRTMPTDNAFTRVMDLIITSSPQIPLHVSTDGFGNSMVYGSYSFWHDHCTIECQGIVECSAYAIADDTPPDFYRYASRFTAWDERISNMAKGRNVLDIMHAVHSTLTYEKYITDNQTSALDAYTLGKGVCQDFAHLMIAACRSAGMLARYANGLVEGEGETHAWVEVYDGEKWLGYDPTYDRQIDFGYLKFAHGRDVADCPTNRGRFYGWTTEFMTINSKMEQ